jgi:hypothetical protein
MSLARHDPPDLSLTMAAPETERRSCCPSLLLHLGIYQQDGESISSVFPKLVLRNVCICSLLRASAATTTNKELALWNTAVHDGKAGEACYGRLWKWNLGRAGHHAGRMKL